MADLLTHVLVAYVGATVLSEWGMLEARYVPVAMGGAVIPDLAKVEWVLSPAAFEAALGLPFSWRVFHRAGGALVVAGLVALCFDRGYRRRAFGVLSAGTASHFVLDWLVIRANGVTPPYLYPIAWWRPPSADLYLSSDRWPLAVAAVVAGGVWLWARRRAGRSGDGRSRPEGRSRPGEGAE